MSDSPDHNPLDVLPTESEKPRKQKDPDELFGHPKGVFVCFMTELWERFSYYGMRALLMFYLTEHFLFTDKQGYAIYGAYTALAWGLPVIGGILADRYLGSRKAVTIGAILLSAGHLLMAWEGPAAIESTIAGDTHIERSEFHFNVFLFALALIVTGVGFLKTNISTVVGALYSTNDPRRDSGFTIFYLGINLGAFVGPLLCGVVGKVYGWGFGFSLAGFGMLLGLLMFLKWQRHLQGHAEPPNPELLKKRVLAGIFSVEMLIWLSAAGLVVLSWALINYQFVGSVLGWFGAVIGATIIYYSIRHCSHEERDRMIVVAILISFSILFWSLYEQMGSSLNLFADRMVNRNVFNIEIKAASLQSLPALFVICLAPLFSMLWVGLGRQKLNPNIPRKFGLALVIIGIAFFMPVIGAKIAEPGEKVALYWFVQLFFLMVCAELCMAPIAMNMITRLCPKRVVGMMMGSFFLSLSVGSYFAGRLAQFTAIEIVDGKVVDFQAAMETYNNSFVWFAIAGIAAGLVLILFSPILFARMHDDAQN